MTLFGIVWMLMLFYTFVRNSIKPILTLLLFSMLFQCNNVIQIGDITCGPQLITSFCFNIRYLISFKSQKQERIKRTPIESLLILLTVYVIIQSSIIHGLHSTNILLKYFQLATYTISFICIGNVSKNLDTNYLYKIIFYLTAFILVVGCLQMLVNMLHISKNNPLKYLIYNDTTGGVCYYKDLNRFYSTFMEPSYCSGLLSGLLFFYLVTFSEQSEISHKKLIIVGILIAIFATLSPTAYGATALLAIFYYIKNRKKNYMIILMFIGFVVLGVGFFTGVFETLINAKLNSKSGVARSMWNENSIELFNQSPVIGNGYKTSRASSIIYTILAELGLVGFAVFCFLTFSIIKQLFSSKKLLCGCAMIVLANIIAGIIACPDLDLCTLWLSLFILSMCKNIKYQDDMSMNSNANNEGSM